MRTLLLKNCSMVYLSYLLDHIARSDSSPYVTVLAHHHAVDNVHTLEHVDDVVSFCGQGLLDYGDMEEEVRGGLSQAGVDQVCFFMDPDQQGGFDNLLDIASRVVKPGGAIIGVTLQGEEVYFSPPQIRRMRLRRWITNSGALLLLSLLALLLPPLLLFSWLLHSRS